jgi:thiamine pyrophosphate-dependent acetolactate synthase large subunit-like protein
MTILASNVLASALRKEGADTLFYLMGGPMFATESACVAEGMRAIDVRHEQAAAMMAHAYARLRNRPGLCMTASGPAALNLVTGLGTSFADATPVVAVSGSCSMRDVGLGAFQEIDQLAAMKPVTKWAARCLEARRIPEMVHKAFNMAISGKPGPVYLEVPGDVLHHQVDENLIDWPNYDTNGAPQRAGGDAALVERAVKLLAEARRPIVLTGSGIIWSGAAAALRSFVEKTGIPFYTTPQGRGVVPEDHEHCYLNARNTAFREADVVLVVGTRLNYIVGYALPPRFNKAAKLIRVDIEPAEIAESRGLTLGVVGDAKLVLEQMVEAGKGRLRPAQYEDWRRHLAETNEEHRLVQEKRMSVDQTPIHPLRLCKEVRDFLDRDAILTVDGQEILNFGRQAIPTFASAHRLNSGTFGTMGVGLPYAIGAKVACPDKQVVCLHGDGSFGMNSMELDTAVRHGIPIIVVISLNGGWTSDPKKERVGRDLGFTAYEKMAQAFGCHGEYVEDPNGIRPALERAKAAVAKGKVAVVNVKTDHNAKATTTRFTTHYQAA